MENETLQTEEVDTTQVKQNEKKEKKKLDIPLSYRIKRYYVYAGLTIFSLLLPFITIGGNHLTINNYT